MSAKPAVNRFIKNKAIGAASIHKNQTANPPKIAPKLFHGINLVAPVPNKQKF